jgi:hypothetical protein
VTRIDVRLIGEGSPRGTLLGSRPNDGSGYWPDFSNTGHLNAEGYPGHLTNFAEGMTPTGNVFVQPADDTVFEYRRLTGKSLVGYLGTGDRLTFRACLFEGTFPNDNLLQSYCSTSVIFEDCTFRPYGLSSPPGNDGTVTSARSVPGTPYDQSWQLLANFTTGATFLFDRCDIWGNAGIEMTGGVAPDNRTIFRDCYIHDQADTDSSGAPSGQGYHHDGIGPNSEGGGHDTLIDHCTIASRGNTNAIALQGASSYNRVTVKDCYLSGFGFTVAFGATTPWHSTNITMTGNVFSAELPTVFGPLYNNAWNSGAGTNVWERNVFGVRQGDANDAYTPADNGSWWWPSDNVGHSTDFAG